MEKCVIWISAYEICASIANKQKQNNKKTDVMINVWGCVLYALLWTDSLVKKFASEMLQETGSAFIAQHMKADLSVTNTQPRIHAVQSRTKFNGFISAFQAWCQDNLPYVAEQP